MLALPSGIMNYRVSSASPTDELLTLGQILSEVGDYAGTILDREHLSLSRRCAARLGKVVSELITRKRIKSRDDLFEMPGESVAVTDLRAMTISELHALYRQWPIRQRQRLAEGREHLTYYYEGRIVRELLSRKPSDRNERLKIDYCVSTYNNELDNLSFILSLPVGHDEDRIYPDAARHYSPEELTLLIKKHSSCRDIIEREILIEYTDLALDLLTANPTQPQPELLSILTALRQKDVIRIPDLKTSNAVVIPT